MQLKRGEIVRSLKRKGFRKRGGDHKFLTYYDHRGKKTQGRTKVSHGSDSQEIGNPLLGQMARQCHLTKSDFLRLIECSMDRGEYEDSLKARARFYD